MDMSIPVNFPTDVYQDIRNSMRALGAQFLNDYHRKVGETRAHPNDFIEALSHEGWAGRLVPEVCRSDLGLLEANVLTEEINCAGGNSGASHGRMCSIDTVVRHGSDEPSRWILPKLARRKFCPQSMAVTEPATDTDTQKIVGDGLAQGCSTLITDIDILGSC
jgi:acyl-CoA dehydrogenase